MSELNQMLEADVLTLGMAADEARRAVTGTNVVTYLRVHVVTAANVAGTFVVPEHASEVRLYGTPESLDEAVAQVRALSQAAGGSRRVAAFSMADLESRGWVSGGVLEAMADAGLMDVAELPVDLLPDVPRAIGALRRVGILPRRITTAHPIGDRKIEIINRVKAAVAELPSLRYAPLSRVAPVDKPTTGYDDVRMVALARLALGATSIEVDWTLYGPKLAQVALAFGADHLDSVSADNDTSLGSRRGAVEDVERNIRAAGFEPREYRPVA